MAELACRNCLPARSNEAPFPTALPIANSVRCLRGGSGSANGSNAPAGSGGSGGLLRTEIKSEMNSPIGVPSISSSHGCLPKTD